MTKTQQYFLDYCKAVKGYVKKRHSNIGVSMCIYTENNNPKMYIPIKMWDALEGHFILDINTGKYNLK